MKNTIKDLLGELKQGLTTIYSGRLRGVYLYGSYATGEEDNESDVDVLVVLDHFDHYAAEVDRTGELGAALSLGYGVSISRVFMREPEWLGPRGCGGLPYAWQRRKSWSSNSSARSISSRVILKAGASVNTFL